MLKKWMYTIIIMLVGLLSTPLIFGAANFDIDINHVPPAWEIDPCPLPPHAGTPLPGDTWTFHNNSQITIQVKVWNRDSSTVTSYTIDPGTSDIHPIIEADCEVKVFDMEGNELVECISMHCRGVPTLTQWGLMAIVVLILSSAVYIMIGRKRSSVPT